jgi:putative iron-dependent peroxidase
MDGVRAYVAPPNALVAVPSTPSDALLRVSGADPGAVLLRERAALSALPSLRVADRVEGFRHSASRDLTGYEDGTENPVGDDAVAVALRLGEGPGVDGSAVVVVQRWKHDLDAYEAMPLPEQNHCIGRDKVSNSELEEAPDSAHVKRTAQEDFSPEAFTVRRSMPWSDGRGCGLVFVSFSARIDPFEAQLDRMVGADDGIVDALFRFTRPVSSATFWCPPVLDGKLDLRAL